MNGAGYVTGRVGQAFALDGSDDLIWAAGSHRIAPEGLTLAAWVRVLDFGSGDWVSTIVAKQANGTPGTGEGGGAQ